MSCGQSSSLAITSLRFRRARLTRRFWRVLKRQRAENQMQLCNMMGGDSEEVCANVIRDAGVVHALKRLRCFLFFWVEVLPPFQGVYFTGERRHRHSFH